MTVQELIERLKSYPQDIEVLGMEPYLRLGSYGPAEVTHGYVVDVHGRVLEATPDEPRARAVVHIG